MSVQCRTCSAPLEAATPDAERTPCPSCGDTRRVFNESICETLEPKEQLRMKLKDPLLTGKDKIRVEQVAGDDLFRLTGKWHKLARVIDRENNRYFEEVIDPETGQVLHRCEELLSEHQGHGSAKPKQTS